MNQDFKQLIRRPGVWGSLLSIVVMAIVAFAYFYPDASAGHTLQQHDQLQGMANGSELTRYAAETGRQAYWTNSLMGGMPTFQISPSYPSTRLFTWLNKVYGLGLPVPSNLLAMMMIGMFILLMTLRLRWYLSLIGAVAWGLSSYFVIIIGAGHIWKFVTLSYVPPTLSGVVLIYNGRRWLGAGVAGLFMMLQIAANHVQMSYYFAWVMAALVVAYGIEALRAGRLRRWGVATAVLAGAMALAVGANLPGLYHTWQYSKETIRNHPTELTVADSDSADATAAGPDRNYITTYSYEPGESFSLLIPNINGGGSARPVKGKMSAQTIADTERGRELMRADRTGQMSLLQLFSQYFGGPEGTNGPVYVGAIVLALALFGAWVVKGPLKWALVVLTLLSVCLALGRNMMWLTDLFIDYVPMYSKFRAVESILVIAEFTLPVLAMLGLQRLITAEHPWQSMRKPLLWSFGLCAAVCLLAMMWPGMFGTPAMSQGDSLTIARYVQAGALPADFDIDQYPEVVTAAESIRGSMVSSDALRSIMYMAVALGALVLMAMGKCSRAVALTVVGVAVATDLYTADKRYLSSDSFTKAGIRSSFSPSAADEVILRDKDPHFRVFSATEFTSARPSYFHKAVGGYHAAKLTRYQDLMMQHLAYMARPEVGHMLHMRADSTLNTQFAELNPDNYRRMMTDLQVLDMLNTRYVIINPSEAPIHNDRALGNAWLVSDLTYVDGADAEMDALNQLDLATQAVADSRFAPALGSDIPAPTPGDTIGLTGYSPDRLTYHARTAAGGLAVFSEVYFPWGWSATVDGEEVPLGRVNYLLRALRLPAGEHEVVMTFHPRSVDLTGSVATASVVGVYAILLLGLWFSVRRRRQS